IARELDDHGIVEAERFTHRLALGGRRIDRHDLADGVAGKAEHRERDDPHGEHDTDGLEGAAKRESEHFILSLFSSWCVAVSLGTNDPGSACPRDHIWQAISPVW